MIRYLKNREIDKLKWDQCIKESFNGQVYAWSWYLDIVHFNWEALVENDYERVFPLTGNHKYGISYLFQPFFAQQLGVYSRTILSPSVINKFLESIPIQYRLVEIKLNTHNKIENSNFNISLHRNHELDLIKSYDRIYQNYNSNTKRNLKKAQDAGLRIFNNVKPDEIIQLFRKNRGRTISHWNDKEYKRLLKLIYTAIYRGQAFAQGAYTADNQLCAGAIFFKSHNKIIFLFSGVNMLGKENHALTFLLDSTIKKFAPGQLVFDFEGSDKPGIARYYKGFGSKEVYYPGVFINRLPLPLKWILKAIKLRNSLKSPTN